MRAVVYVRGEDVRILSRNERDVTRLRRRSGGTSGARQALAAYRDATLFKVIYAWGRNGAVSRVAATSSP
ncbi:hypothetical protein [Paractinoplanes globisporus]|uniref:Uncharacterized protein n=1 Tax=Paractinoplanes globisporus TaxID=113565 RepID=A0ABW6WAR7_9ACTN